MNQEKPKCRLPDFCASSHLIGKTVAALRQAGLETEKSEFVTTIKEKGFNLDYFTAFSIASKYVDFYD